MATTKMAPVLNNMAYEYSLVELRLLLLEQQKERGDMIAIYKAMMGMDYLDRENLLLWDTRDTRRHGKKINK